MRRPSAVPLSALALAVALAGCASLKPAPTDPNAGVALPTAWAASAAGVSGPAQIAGWWKRFGDTQLDALIDAALAANTDVASAKATLRESRALADVQGARLQPSLSASGSAQRGRSQSSPASNSFRAGFDASWEPDIFGANRSAAAAGALNAQASAATLGDVQVSVAAEVALTYLELRSAEARRAIAETNLASQQETLQITQWRVQAGLATSLDAEQARSAAEQTRAQVTSLATSAQRLRHQLALLTGRTVGELTLTAGALPSVPTDLALSFPAQTLRQRPDVRAAELQVSAAAQRVVSADAARYPSFNLSGSLGLSALTLSGLSGPGAVASAILASVSVPVFDGGAAKAQVRAEEAALDRARAAHRAAVLVALKDVEDALVAMKGDRERLDTLRRAADAAANADLLARQRYAGGLVDFQTVLQTQRTLLSAQDSVAAAGAALASDHVQLYKALGGGWEPDTHNVSAALAQTR